MKTNQLLNNATFVFDAKELPKPEKLQSVPLTGKGQILEIVQEGHPLLRTQCKPYDFNEHSYEETLQIYYNLVDTMRTFKGLGLAANQVGYDFRMFVLETNDEYPEGLINPRIVDQGPDVILSEGCLSFPNIFIKVKRPSRCRIRYQLINGKTDTQEFQGLSARVALHEYDHLDGITMKDRVSRIHWDMAISKRRKLR